jgi:phosphoribosylaminoimidazolecarboxamide formyltransferase / IMP cyclohydrolase
MRALISVSDKSGIVSFAHELEKMGFEIVSTGGTYKILKENHIKVIPVKEVTGFPEILDGRVKTLHPLVHGGLLAKRDNKDHIKTCKENNIKLFDLVVVNLYPFERTISKENIGLDEVIENIDIGGPTMLRSAAKNYTDIAVIVNPEQYDEILVELKQNNNKVSLQTKANLASEVFKHTARYDSIIAGYFTENLSTDDNFGMHTVLTPIFHKVKDMRYGENPHQEAAFYKLVGGQGLSKFVQLHGKELSYNNIVDLEAAWGIVSDLELPAAAIIKHTNPCGAAVAENVLEAYKKAYEGDPLSAFGSIVGLNRNVDVDTASQISKTFVEAVIAPGFDEEALKILMKKPSIRLIKLPNIYAENTKQVFRFVSGGILVQTPDNRKVEVKDLLCVTKTKVKPIIQNDLLFAFVIVKHVKSNAIVVVKNGQLLGVGAGQMSRIDATEIALKKADKKAKGAVLASDAFFPFKDSVELAATVGISAIIQPGGSKRDQESIDACNENNISMVTTGVRHFKH